MYKAGTYDFKFTVTYDTNSAIFDTVTFSIEISIRCTSDSLSIDTDIWRDEEYYINDSIKTLNWVPDETGLEGCGDVLWEVGMLDGNYESD